MLLGITHGALGKEMNRYVKERKHSDLTLREIVTGGCLPIQHTEKVLKSHILSFIGRGILKCLAVAGAMPPNRSAIFR